MFHKPEEQKKIMHAVLVHMQERLRLVRSYRKHILMKYDAKKTKRAHKEVLEKIIRL